LGQIFLKDVHPWRERQLAALRASVMSRVDDFELWALVLKPSVPFGNVTKAARRAAP
jgi:hypothetical protein